MWCILSATLFQSSVVCKYADVPYCCQRIVPHADCRCHLWQLMVRKLMFVRVDNMAVVEVLKATYSQEPQLMHLIRMLVFLLPISTFGFQHLM